MLLALVLGVVFTFCVQTLGCVAVMIMVLDVVHSTRQQRRDDKEKPGAADDRRECVVCGAHDWYIPPTAPKRPRRLNLP